MFQPERFRPVAPFLPHWGSPQARGLVLWLAGGGSYRDLVRGYPLTPAASGAPATLIEYATREGLAYRSIPNNNYWTYPALPLTVPFSLAWWGIRFQNANHFILQTSDGATSTTRGAALAIAGGAASAWVARYYDSTTGIRAATAATSITIGQLTHIVAVCRGATDWSLYQDGLPTTPSYSGSGGALANGTGVGTFGRGNNGVNAQDAAHLDLRVYDRDLTDAEARALYDPQSRWDLYWVPSTRAYAFLSGGATAYDLDAQPGAVTVTGVQAQTVAGRALDGQPGSYAVTGVLAGVAFQPAIHAVPGVYAVTGVAATVPAVLFVDGQPGAVSLTGVAAGLSWGPALDAAPGAVTLTGVAATVPVVAVLSATPGVITLTGIDATLEDNTGGAIDYELDAQPGAFVTTGVAAGLSWQPVVNAQPGAVTLTGSAAGVAWGAALAGLAGSLTMTGVAAGVAVSATLAGLAGSVTLTGSAAGVTRQVPLSADPGAYVVTGVAATLPAALRFAADPGVITLTGIAADLDASADVTPEWLALVDVTVAFSALSGAAVVFPDLAGRSAGVPLLLTADVVTPED